MTHFLNQLALMEVVTRTAQEVDRNFREEQRLVQFLIDLRDEFGGLGESIFHCTLLVAIDLVIN